MKLTTKAIYKGVVFSDKEPTFMLETEELTSDIKPMTFSEIERMIAFTKKQLKFYKDLHKEICSKLTDEEKVKVTAYYDRIEKKS